MTWSIDPNGRSAIELCSVAATSSSMAGGQAGSALDVVSDPGCRCFQSKSPMESGIKTDCGPCCLLTTVTLSRFGSDEKVYQQGS